MASPPVEHTIIDDDTTVHHTPDNPDVRAADYMNEREGISQKWTRRRRDVPHYSGRTDEAREAVIGNYPILLKDYREQAKQQSRAPPPNLSKDIRSGTLAQDIRKGKTGISFASPPTRGGVFIPSEKRKINKGTIVLTEKDARAVAINKNDISGTTKQRAATVFVSTIYAGLLNRAKEKERLLTDFKEADPRGNYTTSERKYWLGAIKGAPDLAEDIYSGSKNLTRRYEQASTRALGLNVSKVLTTQLEMDNRFFGNVQMPPRELVPANFTSKEKTTLIAGGFAVSQAIPGVNLVVDSLLLGYGGAGLVDDLILKKEGRPIDLTVNTLAVLPGLRRVSNMVSQPAVSLGAEFVEPSKVFDEGVLADKSMFPMSSSVEFSIKEFTKTRAESGRLKGTHVTPASFSKTTTAGPSKTPHLEDSGLYITPAGRGSPYFLRLDGMQADYSLSLNPFGGWFKKPNIVNIEYDAIGRIPDSLIQKKGFTESNLFLAEQANTGKAFITKRSELGQRGIYNKGLTTSELEAVIPEGALMQSLPIAGNWLNKLRGFSKYTTFKGKAVPIREYGIETTGIGKPAQTFKPVFEKLSKGTVDYYRTSKPVVYPYGSAAFVNSSITTTSSKSRVTSTATRTSEIRPPYRTPQYRPAARPRSYPTSYKLGTRSGAYSRSTSTRLNPYRPDYRPIDRVPPPDRIIPPPPERKPIRGGGLPFLSIDIDKGPKVKGLRKPRASGFKTAYTPSLTALAFNIKGSKVPKFNVISGLGIRPILK